MENQASIRIFADDHRLIELGANSWRLLSANGNGQSEPLAETTDAPSLRCAPAFGTRQRLPGDELTATDIERVVLGWSASDETWHLGLILVPTVADARGSRWCGLARWKDPASEAHRAEAAEAGRALATVLAKPLAIVPPHPGEAHAATDTERAPAVLPALPYTLDDWVLTAPTATQLHFQLHANWARNRQIRGIFYLVWAALFLIMAVTSLTSGIRLPDPQVLPVLGFASGILLIVLGIRTFLQVRRQTRAIDVDAADQIDSVYASQVVKLKTRGTPVEQIRYGELNLLLRDGQFRPVITRLRFDIKQSPSAPAPTDGTLARLTEANARTPLQAAAVRMGLLLGVPAWDDRRSD